MILFTSLELTDAQSLKKTGGLLARKEEEERTVGDTCVIDERSVMPLPLSQSILKGRVAAAGGPCDFPHS